MHVTVGSVVVSVTWQVPELLSDEILAKMHAPPKPDVPVLDVHELPNADGFIFGFPTRCALKSHDNKMRGTRGRLESRDLLALP